MIRVAMVGPFPNHPLRVVGGVAGAARYLADELERRSDVELTVVVPQGAPGQDTVCERWGRMRVFRLGRRGLWRFLPGTAYDLAGGRRQVADFLDGLAPDIVHFQGTAFIAAAWRRPGVLTIHGVAERDAAWDSRETASRWLRRQVLRVTEERGRRSGHPVILISESVRDILPREPAPRTWRIDNPVDASFFEVVRRPEPGRVLCLSRVRPLKNVAGLIESFALASRGGHEMTLRVAGASEPGYLDFCRRRAEELGVAARVAFLGQLGMDAVREELARAACLALVSFQENAPLSVAEAMAAGVPVIASRVGGLPEMIEDGRSGLLVGAGEPVQAADALRRLLADPALARSMGERARALARDRHAAAAVAERTVAVYREILSEGAGRAA